MDKGQTENSQKRQLSGRQFGALDRDALEEAKRNLKTCLMLGLTERFEETFELFRRALRLRMPFLVTMNVSPLFKVSGRAVDLVRERNELDLELCSFARELFAEHARHSSPIISAMSLKSEGPDADSVQETHHLALCDHEELLRTGGTAIESGWLGHGECWLATECAWFGHGEWPS